MMQQEARFIPLKVTGTRQSPGSPWEFRSQPHRCEQGQERNWTDLIASLVAAVAIRDEPMKPGRWTSRVDLSTNPGGEMSVMMTTDPARTVWMLTCTHVCEPPEWLLVWQAAIAIARVVHLAG